MHTIINNFIKKSIGLLLMVIALTCVSCKKENMTNIVDSLTVNGKTINVQSSSSTIYDEIPYSNNLVVSATMQKLQGTEWVDFTVDDVTGGVTTATNVRSHQKIAYSNNLIQASMPGGLLFMQSGRTYIVHINFTNTAKGNLLQVDLKINR